MYGFLHQSCRVIDLEDAEVRPPLDREQNAVGPVDARFEERGGHGEFCCLDGSVGTARGSDPHEGGTCTLHHRLHVGEVEVDEAGGGDEVGDALYAGEEHLVGGGERFEEADAPIADLEQTVVGHDDEGVDLGLEARDAHLRLRGAAFSLETEGAGDDSDREGADRLGDAGHDGRAARAGAAALASGDEDHIGARKRLLDLFGMVFGSTTADLGVGSRAEPAGQFAAHVELDVGVTHQQRLCVGVDRDELDAAQADLDHSVDGVHTTAADSDDLDDS